MRLSGEGDDDGDVKEDDQDEVGDGAEGDDGEPGEVCRWPGHC